MRKKEIKKTSEILEMFLKQSTLVIVKWIWLCYIKLHYLMNKWQEYLKLEWNHNVAIVEDNKEDINLKTRIKLLVV